MKISQIRTLSVEYIGRRMARVAAEELGQIIEGPERDHRRLRPQRAVLSAVDQRMTDSAH